MFSLTPNIPQTIARTTQHPPTGGGADTVASLLCNALTYTVWYLRACSSLKILASFSVSADASSACKHVCGWGTCGSRLDDSVDQLAFSGEAQVGVPVCTRTAQKAGILNMTLAMKNAQTRASTRLFLGNASMSVQASQATQPTISPACAPSQHLQVEKDSCGSRASCLQ